jgi:hypothetical protein
MRPVITAIAIASGLVALWAAIVPLTAQPAPKSISAASPALSKALFLCRGPNGIDRGCTAALVRALMTEQSTQAAATADAPSCHLDPATLSPVRD